MVGATSSERSFSSSSSSSYDYYYYYYYYYKPHNTVYKVCNCLTGKIVSVPYAKSIITQSVHVEGISYAAQH